jgi:hypothetical protein
MNKIRYEFILINDKGEPDTWGYRSNEKAARKRKAEIQDWIDNRPHWKGYKVECFKVISTETRHPVNF